MRSFHKATETVSNIAIILVAVALLITLANRYFAGSSTVARAPADSQLVVGTAVSLPGVDWSKGDKTLVMALSTTCHYCAESSSFYQRLATEKLTRSGVRLIAIMPQTLDESRGYLSEKDIVVDEVFQTGPEALSVKATPTLILVDRNGLVTNTWVGKLSPEEEIKVFNKVFGS